MFETIGRWIADVGAWWPTLLAVSVVSLMAVALVGLVLRFVLMLRGKPGGYEPAVVLRGGCAATPWRTLARVAALALGARLLLYLWAWCIACVSARAWMPPWHSFSALWTHWDAYHYVKLANQWYTAPGVAGPNDHLMLVFFPLFPLLLRVLLPVFGDAVTAAAALNALCTMGSACLLYALVERRYGSGRARWAVTYLLVNPFSLFLGAPYSEALFLLLTLAALDAASRRKYVAAGLWAALSAYARMLGLVVIGAIVLEGIQEWKERRAAHRPTAAFAVKVALCAAMGALGFAAYLWLNIQVSGSPFTYLRYQRENWSQRFGSLWNTARVTGDYLLRDFGQDSFVGTWLPQALAMLAVGLLLAKRQKHLPLPWAAYAWVYVVIALAPTWLLSGPRYLMALAVLPVLQAVMTGRRWFHITNACLQGALLLTYTYLYVVARCVL